MPENQVLSPATAVNLPVGFQTDLGVIPAQDANYVAQALELEAQNAALNNPLPNINDEFIAKLPEKFRNAANPLEALLASYQHLEGKLGSPSASGEGNSGKPVDTGSTTAPTTIEPPSANSPASDVKAYLTDNGVDFDALSATYQAQGSFTDAQYAELAEVGLPKHVVDTYIAGQQAVVAQQQNEVFSVVGGQERYMEMINWAKDNVSAGEVAAFNSIIKSGDVGQMKLAIMALNAQYKAGGPPKLMTGSTNSPSATVDKFNSEAEVVAAMMDKRYQNDVAYQQMVAKKLANSHGVFGG